MVEDREAIEGAVMAEAGKVSTDIVAEREPDGGDMGAFEGSM